MLTLWSRVVQSRVYILSLSQDSQEQEVWRQSSMTVPWRPVDLLTEIEMDLLLARALESLSLKSVIMVKSAELC